MAEPTNSTIAAEASLSNETKLTSCYSDGSITFTKEVIKNIDHHPDECYEEIYCGTNYIEYILIFYVWQGKVSCFQFSHCNTGKIPSISSPAGSFLDIVNIYVWDFKDETYKHDPYRWTPNIRCNCIRFCSQLLETLFYEYGTTYIIPVRSIQLLQAGENSNLKLLPEFEHAQRWTSKE